MSNNEVMVLTPEQIDQLAKRAGAQQTQSDYLPQVKVNYDDEEKPSGKEIKPGLFVVTGQDKPVYAKSVKFRPFTHHFQYIKYDDVAKKVTNRSLFIPNFREEARDENGTLRCGKPPSKELKANPALAKVYEDVTVYRSVQGVVSYEGTDSDGNKVKVDKVESVLRLKGANFMPFEEEYFSKLGSKDRIWDYELTLTTSKEKNGASTYYVIHYDADLGKKLPMTNVDFDLGFKLSDRVDAVNKEVDRKFYDSVHNRTSDDTAQEALKLVNGSTVNGNSKLDDDFDDIPF